MLCSLVDHPHSTDGRCPWKRGKLSEVVGAAAYDRSDRAAPARVVEPDRVGQGQSVGGEGALAMSSHGQRRREAAAAVPPDRLTTQDDREVSEALHRPRGEHRPGGPRRRLQRVEVEPHDGPRWAAPHGLPAQGGPRLGRWRRWARDAAVVTREQQEEEAHTSSGPSPHEGLSGPRRRGLTSRQTVGYLSRICNAPRHLADRRTRPL